MHDDLHNSPSRGSCQCSYCRRRRRCRSPSGRRFLSFLCERMNMMRLRLGDSGEKVVSHYIYAIFLQPDADKAISGQRRSAEPSNIDSLPL